ncbi:MAG: isopenicillin-N N-acyltransferase-like protein [Gammaproteobacteria bacterium]|jgi:isopenicillin-N N-acyltransferase-like protein
MSGFPHFHFSGTPAQRGAAYGETLRQRIQTTYALYEDKLFAQSALSNGEIASRAEHVRKIVTDFSPAYTIELDAIASGSGLQQWQIYALNARTEILNTPVAECTALYFANDAILGQNWDWVAALEELAVLVTWDLPDGHQVLSFTEPGMLGKIGLNNRGIGVCLNILFARHQLDGLPVHILIRALLDCGSIEQTRSVLRRSGFGKSSHLLVADDQGNACSTEFVGDERFEVEPVDGVLLHTNHCVAPAAKNRTAIIPTTIERLEQGANWLARTSERDLETMRTILLDDSAGPISINGSYHSEALLDGQDVGTCATILMDLKARVMQIKKGPGQLGSFASLAL